jgi:hypothetical protein
MLCCYQPVHTPVRCAIEVTTKDIRHPSTFLLKHGNTKYYLPFHFFIIINITVSSKWKSQDSSVGITAGYGLVYLGSISGSGKRFFSNPQCPDWIWGPPSLQHNRYKGLFPCGVKWPECEADHSHPSSAKVKNGGAIPPLYRMSS